MGASRPSSASLAEIQLAWDRAVDRTPGVDEFCASSLWSFAAAESFPKVGPPLIVTDGVGFCGMRSAPLESGGTALVGLDPIWGFATPCVGPAPSAARALVAVMDQAPHPITVIGGQDETSPLCATIARTLEGTYRLLRGADEVRLRADLSDGVDAWFSRRSSRFRQRMRGLERAAAQARIKMVDASADNPDAVIDRILDIEQRSWKGAADTGLASEDLAGFYRAMAWRLGRCDALRVVFAVDSDDTDIGFILGGVRGLTYRGLQLSYVADRADLGVGHLLQLHQMRTTAREGLATYDLGMDMPYKRRWADAERSTFSLIAVASRG